MEVMEENKDIVPFNAYEDGTCRTLKAQCGQNSAANFIRQDGLGATAVCEMVPINTDKDGNSLTITSHYHKAGASDFRSRENGNPSPHIAVVEIFRDKRLQSLVESGKIDPTKVSYLDTYNQSVQEEAVGCLKARIDQNNAYFVTEPRILTPRRTAEGCELRKQGIDVFANKELVPREDDVCNTLTSVQKDNYMVEDEPKIVGDSRDEKGKITNYHLKDMANTLHGSSGNFGSTGQYIQHDAGVCCGYRIRKLTERECFRLMDVSEEDIDKIQSAGISKSAQYRLAGNSIVVSCLYHIFRELFIDKSKPVQGTLF